MELSSKRTFVSLHVYYWLVRMKHEQESYISLSRHRYQSKGLSKQFRKRMYIHGNMTEATLPISPTHWFNNEDVSNALQAIEYYYQCKTL